MAISLNRVPLKIRLRKRKALSQGAWGWPVTTATLLRSMVPRDPLAEGGTVFQDLQLEYPNYFVLLGGHFGGHARSGPVWTRRRTGYRICSQRSLTSGADITPNIQTKPPHSRTRIADLRWLSGRASPLLECGSSLFALLTHQEGQITTGSALTIAAFGFTTRAPPVRRWPRRISGFSIE